MSHIVVVGVPAGKSFQIGRDGIGVRVVAVDNLQQVKQEAQKAPIDGVVLSEKTAKEGLSDLPHVIDVSKTLIISGPPSLHAALDTMKWLLGKFDGKEAKRGLRAFPGLTLEDYVELKFGEFVHTMKASSAKGLHVTLIKAVERPLIQHALHETNGNQIQAAKLLGMNRNTLRKKITEYRIPVPRRSRQQAESS